MGIKASWLIILSFDVNCWKKMREMNNVDEYDDK